MRAISKSYSNKLLSQAQFCENCSYHCDCSCHCPCHTQTVEAPPDMFNKSTSSNNLYIWPTQTEISLNKHDMDHCRCFEAASTLSKNLNDLSEHYKSLYSQSVLEIDSEKEKSSALECKLQKYQQLFNDSQKDKCMLIDKLKSQNDQITKLISMLNDVTAQKKELEEEYFDYKQCEITRIKEEHDHALRRAKADFDQQLQILSNQQNTYANETINLKYQLKKLNEEDKAAFEKMSKDLNEQNDELKAELLQKQMMLEKLNCEIECLRNQLKQVNEENLVNIRELKTQITSLNKSLGDRLAEINTLKSDICLLSKEKVGHIKNIEDLEILNTQSTSEISNLNRRIQELEDDLAELNNEFNRSRKEYELMNTNYTNVCSQLSTLKTLEKDYSDLLKDNKILKKNSEENAKIIEQNNKLVKVLKDKLKEAEDKINLLQDELDKNMETNRIQNCQ